jgi:putative drug exporter of the RND superfamily
MFTALARSVVAHPWRTTAVWLILAGVAIGLSSTLSSVTTSNQQSFLPKSFESVQAQDVGNKYFAAQSGATGSLVVSRQDGGQLTQADQSKVSDLATSLTNDKIPGVLSVKVSASSFSANGKVAALQIAFQGQPGDALVNSAVITVRDKTDAYLAGSGLKNGLTGNAAISVDTTDAYNHADNIITIATVVLIVLLLGLIFRSPIIAVLPIVIIGIVHSVTTGLTADLAKAFGFQVSNSLASILVVVLFGIGTDYIVFILFRYRERLRHGVPPQEALVFACGVVGKVVASSALTVIGAFAALFLAKLGSLKTLAPGLIVAVAVMLITALTLVPAIFALFGKHLFWPFGPGKTPETSVFAKQAALVARRPAAMVAGLGLVLIVLAIFSSGYKATYDTLAELPSSTASQVAYNTLGSAFPAGSLSPTQVYVTGNAPLTQSSLSNLTTKLGQAHGVAQVAAPQFSSDSKAALINVILKDDPYSNTALDSVANSIRPAAHGAVPGDQVLVGGQTATFVDIRTQLGADTRLVIPVAFAIIAVILAVLLGALIAPLNLLACVALAFAATLGAVVLVFLHGLGYSGIDFTIPMVLYLFVVAIGTDYNILLAARLREEFHNGFSARESARIAIANDAPTAAAAGIILALTFASLMLAGIANLTELGFGVAVGIIIAAFGMAPVLVPGLSALEGRGFWWPGRARVLPADSSLPGVAEDRAAAAGPAGGAPAVGAPASDETEKKIGAPASGETEEKIG